MNSLRFQMVQSTILGILVSVDDYMNIQLCGAKEDIIAEDGNSPVELGEILIR